MCDVNNISIKNVESKTKGYFIFLNVKSSYLFKTKSSSILIFSSEALGKDYS